jgi:hypothetical protein
MTTCWFTCQRCGYIKSEFDVPRQAGQSVNNWVREFVLPALRGSHLTRAPLCTATKAAVFIPTDRGERALGNKEFG